MPDDPNPPQAAAEAAARAEAARTQAEAAAIKAQTLADQLATTATEINTAIRSAEAKFEATIAATPTEELKAVNGKAEKALSVVILITGLATLILMLAVGLGHARGLSFKDNLWTSLGNSLGALLVVSLIIERVVETVVSIWGDKTSDELLTKRDLFAKKAERRRSEIRELQAQLNTAIDADKAKIVAQIDKARQEMKEAEVAVETNEELLVPFGARTRRLAAWSGLGVGTLAAAVGFRLLENLVTGIPNPLPQPGTTPSPNFQYYAFFMVDTVLTGAVLAGGSVFIHRIFTVYDSFMEATRARAKSAKDASETR